MQTKLVKLRNCNLRSSHSAATHVGHDWGRE